MLNKFMLSHRPQTSSSYLRTSLQIIIKIFCCLWLQHEEPRSPESEPMDEAEAEESPESEVGMCLYILLNKSY